MNPGFLPHHRAPEPAFPAQSVRVFHLLSRRRQQAPLPRPQTASSARVCPVFPSPCSPASPARVCPPATRGRSGARARSAPDGSVLSLPSLSSTGWRSRRAQKHGDPGTPVSRPCRKQLPVQHGVDAWRLTSELRCDPALKEVRGHAYLLTAWLFNLNGRWILLKTFLESLERTLSFALIIIW